MEQKVFEDDNNFDEENDLSFDEEYENLQNQETIEVLLNDYYDELENYDKEFLETILGKLNLTEKQNDKLEQITKKYLEE